MQLPEKDRYITLEDISSVYIIYNVSILSEIKIKLLNEHAMQDN